MSRRSPRLPLRRLIVPLALAALAALAACAGSVSPGEGGERRTFRLTGADVRPIDRRPGMAHVVSDDTLRGQFAFSVTARTELLAGSGGASAGGAGDQVPDTVVNPTVPGRSWLSVDRVITHRGVEIAAGTNLLAVPAVRDAFDGSRLDLSFPQLSPFAVGEVHLRTDRFSLARGPAVLTLWWETADGERFADTVRVYVDLPGS